MSARDRRVLLRRALYAVLGLVAVYEILRGLGDPGDYRAFVTFGEVALSGQLAYLPDVEAQHLQGHWATWPPSFVTVAVALELVDRVAHPPAILLWQTLNLLALAAVFAWLARWLYGRRVSLEPGAGRVALASLPVLAGLLVPMRLVLSNFEHEQANLVILGLAAAAFWLFGTGRRWLGGLSLGVSSAFKGTPLLALPYLAWRGRWRDLGAAVAGVAVAWLVLPAAVVGPGELPAWYEAWWGTLPGLDLQIASPMNQSLQATSARLAHGVDLMGGEEATAGIVGSSLRVLGGARAAPWVGGIAAALAAGSAVAFGRPLERVSRHREALELGVVFTAMALFSPLGWKSHFVGMVVLCAALASRTSAGRRLRASGGDAPRAPDPGGRASGPARGPTTAARHGELPDRVTVGALVAAFAAINLTATDLVGDRLADAFEMTGVVTWSAVLLVAVALAHLWSERVR